jgi:hypothetical protein
MDVNSARIGANIGEREVANVHERREFLELPPPVEF